MGKLKPIYLPIWLVLRQKWERIKIELGKEFSTGMFTDLGFSGADQILIRQNFELYKFESTGHGD